MNKLTSSVLASLIMMSLASVALAKEHVSTSEKDAEKPIVGSISVKNLSVKDYPAVAKVSSGQAAKAATDAVPGQVLSLGLEQEDGFLVYAVEVVNPDSGLHEINIDAGNGKILSNAKKGSKVSERDEDGEEDDD